MMADNQKNSSDKLNDDLIRQVADEVYRLLLQEARIDFERRRITRPLKRTIGGK